MDIERKQEDEPEAEPDVAEAKLPSESTTSGPRVEVHTKGGRL